MRHHGRIQQRAKWFAPEDPIEVERRRSTITPDTGLLDESLDRMIEALRNEGQGAAADTIEAERKRAMYGEKVKRAFQRRFWKWLMGQGTREEIEHTQWGSGHCYDDPEVRAYLGAFLRKRKEWLLKLEMLKTRPPRGIDQFYLYYKYIVRAPRPDDRDPDDDASDFNFLYDWDYFMRAFDDSTQEPLDPKHPFWTRPYGPDTWQQAPRSSEGEEQDDRDTPEAIARRHFQPVTPPSGGGRQQGFSSASSPVGAQTPELATAVPQGSPPPGDSPGEPEGLMFSGVSPGTPQFSSTGMSSLQVTPGFTGTPSMSPAPGTAGLRKGVEEVATKGHPPRKLKWAPAEVAVDLAEAAKEVDAKVQTPPPQSDPAAKQKYETELAKLKTNLNAAVDLANKNGEMLLAAARKLATTETAGRQKETEYKEQIAALATNIQALEAARALAEAHAEGATKQREDMKVLLEQLQEENQKLSAPNPDLQASRRRLALAIEQASPPREARSVSRLTEEADELLKARIGELTPKKLTALQELIERRLEEQEVEILEDIEAEEEEESKQQKAARRQQKQEVGFAQIPVAKLGYNRVKTMPDVQPYQPSLVSKDSGYEPDETAGERNLRRAKELAAVAGTVSPKVFEARKEVVSGLAANGEEFPISIKHMLMHLPEDFNLKSHSAKAAVASLNQNHLVPFMQKVYASGRALGLYDDDVLEKAIHGRALVAAELGWNDPDADPQGDILEVAIADVIPDIETEAILSKLPEDKGSEIFAALLVDMYLQYLDNFEIAGSVPNTKESDAAVASYAGTHLRAAASLNEFVANAAKTANIERSGKIIAAFEGQEEIEPGFYTKFNKPALREELETTYGFTFASTTTKSVMEEIADEFELANQDNDAFIPPDELPDVKQARIKIFQGYAGMPADDFNKGLRGVRALVPNVDTAQGESDPMTRRLAMTKLAIARREEDDYDATLATDAFALALRTEGGVNLKALKAVYKEEGGDPAKMKGKDLTEAFAILERHRNIQDVETEPFKVASPHKVGFIMPPKTPEGSPIGLVPKKARRKKRKPKSKGEEEN